MTIITNEIVSFLKDHGSTSLAVLDLAFFNPNREVILQMIHYLVDQGIVVLMPDCLNAGVRPIPAICLTEHLQ